MMSYKGNPELQKKVLLNTFKKKKKKQEFAVDKMIMRSHENTKHTDLLSDNRRYSSLRITGGKHCYRNYGEGDRCIEDNLPFLEDEDYDERQKRDVKQAVYEAEIKSIFGSDD